MARGALIHPRLGVNVRGLVAGSLIHTYTRVTAAEDVYGTPQTPTTTSGLPCRYLPERPLSVSDRGDMAPDLPSLLVVADDTLTAGDSVENITSESGSRVLLAGPVAVQRVIDVDPVGTVLLRRADLGSAQVA